LDKTPKDGVVKIFFNCEFLISFFYSVIKWQTNKLSLTNKFQ